MYWDEIKFFRGIPQGHATLGPVAWVGSLLSGSGSRSVFLTNFFSIGICDEEAQKY